MTVTEAGDRTLRLGAEALALTGMEVLTSPDLLRRIKEEYEETKKKLEIQAD